MVPGLSRLLPRLSGLQRMVHQWRTDSPVELAAQLSQHQQDVHDALLRHASNVWPRLEQRVVSPGSYGAHAGEMIICDTAAGNVTVTLPEATGRNVGEICAVVKLGLANEVRIFVPRGSLDAVPVNATPKRIAAPGLWLFLATTRGWWSVGGDAEGTYSPNYSAGSGIDLTNPRNASFRWHRTGNTMHVDGRVTVDLASPSGEKEFRISLPADPGADFTSTTDAHGSGSMVAASLATECQSVMVESVISTSLVRVVSTSAAASGARAFRFHFVYRL